MYGDCSRADELVRLAPRQRRTHFERSEVIVNLVQLERLSIFFSSGIFPCANDDKVYGAKGAHDVVLVATSVLVYLGLEGHTKRLRSSAALV